MLKINITLILFSFSLKKIIDYVLKYKIVKKKKNRMKFAFKVSHLLHPEICL